jgi:hypothetical protein
MNGVPTNLHHHHHPPHPPTHHDHNHTRTHTPTTTTINTTIHQYHHRHEQPSKRAIRLRIDGPDSGGGGQASITTTTAVPVCAGVETVEVSATLSGNNLRDGDSCKVQVSTDGGAGWTTVAHVGRDEDDRDETVVASETVAVVARHGVRLRLLLDGNAPWDRCFLYSAAVTCPTVAVADPPEPDLGA